MSKTSESYLKGVVEPKIDTVDTNVDSALADTNELQTDWANGGRLDLILDARASQTSVDSASGTAVLKTVTFSNSTGTVPVFTVTGDVLVKVYAVCSTSLTSAAAANISLGISTDTDAMILNTVATAIQENEIWYDITPANRIVSVTGGEMAYIISSGENINLTLSAQVDTGVINFYCRWFPLPGGAGTVVAA